MSKKALFMCLTMWASLSIAQEARQWTSADGSRTFEGRMLEYSAEEVRIQRTADRETFKVPLTSLSESDRSYIAGLLADDARDVGVKEGPFAEQIASEFVKAVSAEGLNYQFFGNPRWQGEDRFPLLIWLHGAGQSGSDNEAQMGKPTKVFSVEEAQAENPCFILAPQCPSREIGWKDGVESNLVALISALVEHLPIDPNRVYLTGSSMGGSGSWRIAANHPEMFAAVVPLCGGGDPKTAEALKQIPIWAFHGDQDEDVPVERSRTMVEAIRGAGGELIVYSELEGEGHLIAAGVYERQDLPEWLFAQSRSSSEPVSN
ncbi:MAG: prolyl oligopeptidase family serine peptidase [Verrucomicrobiota bacterium]